MEIRLTLKQWICLTVSLLPGVGWGAAAPTPSADQALKLAPLQRDVDYSRPTAEEAARCRIAAQKIDGNVGWVVEDGNGVILRKFVDTNGDNKVDQWSYFKDGLEVYRDIDGNFNGKADQYRWFHTGGSRWGIDKDEDGKIDYWKYLSAEEATAEVVAALADRDIDRFLRAALTAAELKSLGLGSAKAKEVGAKVDALEAQFKDLLAKQKATEGMRWVQFSGGRPGVVPARTDGSTQDVQVYENVVAIVQSGNVHGQVQIGTLVLGPSGWRVIDVPHPMGEGQSELASGVFFRAAPPERSRAPATAGSAPTEEVQKLMSAIEDLDKAASQVASVEEKAKYNSRKADLLEQMAERSKADERAMWYRQLADMVSAAVQSGAYPEGAKRLQTLFDKLSRGNEKSLAAYVRFRQLTAEYGLAMQDKKADFVAIQTEWLKKLENYIAQYPDSTDTSEAMFQLAIAQEFAGKEEDAARWYTRIVKDFPTAPAAKKAAGAKARLDSVGNVLSIQGKSPSGEPVNTGNFRGKVVLVQYWATWCEPCKADMPALKELVAKYGPSRFAVVGVSLDYTAKEMADYVSRNQITWPQIFEEGGLESRPAVELGILTLPTMILIDTDGKVVHRNVHMAELDRELKKLIR